MAEPDIADALAVDIKVGVKDGQVVIQSMGNDVVAPNFLVVSPETAEEIATQLLHCVRMIRSSK